jgi:hypothetical protein
MFNCVNQHALINMIFHVQVESKLSDNTSESSLNSSHTTLSSTTSSSMSTTTESYVGGRSADEEAQVKSDLAKAKNELNSVFNVSSLNNFLLKINPLSDDLQSVQGAKQHSIDLSHASRDPMVSGPVELFNKNVCCLRFDCSTWLHNWSSMTFDFSKEIKLALEEKQKQIL